MVRTRLSIWRFQTQWYQQNFCSLHYAHFRILKRTLQVPLCNKCSLNSLYPLAFLLLILILILKVNTEASFCRGWSKWEGWTNFKKLQFYTLWNFKKVITIFKMFSIKEHSTDSLLKYIHWYHSTCTHIRFNWDKNCIQPWTTCYK